MICGRNAGNGQRLAGEFDKLGCRTRFVSADLAKVADCQSVVARLANISAASITW